MKKITQKIAMIFIVIMLANTFSGCVAILGAVAVGAVKGTVAVIGGVVEVGEMIGDEIEDARYKEAAKTVILYDEVDTFGTGDL